MVQAFGQGVLGNRLRVAGLIREAVGGNSYTGNPMGKRGEKPTPKEEAQEPTRISDAARAEIKRQVASGENDIVDETYPERQQTFLQEQADSYNITVDELMEARKNIVSAGGLDEAVMQLTGQSRSTDPVVRAGEITKREVGKFGDSLALGVKETPFYPGSDSNVVADKFIKNTAKSLYEAVVPDNPVVRFAGGLGIDFGIVDSLNKLVGIESDSANDKEAQAKAQEAAAKPPIEKAATSPADVDDPSAFSRGNIANSPGAAANAVLGQPPVTEQGAQSMAEQLNRDSRPTLANMFNAVGLLKMKIISPGQLMNYAQTGKFDRAAAAKINLVTTDGVTTVFENGVPVRQVQTGNIGGDQLSQEEVYDLQAKYTKNKVIDWETGKPSVEGHERLMTNIHAANRLLGYTPEQQSDRTNMDWMAKAQGYVDDFDPNTSQNLWGDGGADWNPFSDPKLGANALMFGYKAVQWSVESKLERDRFLNDYGIVVANSVPRGVNLAKIVDQGEGEVAKAIEAWRKENGAAPSAKQRAHIRTKTLEKLIAETY